MQQLHNSWHTPGETTAVKHTFTEAPAQRNAHTHTRLGSHGNAQLSSSSDHTPVNMSKYTPMRWKTDELTPENTLSPFFLSHTHTDVSKLALAQEKWWHTCEELSHSSRNIEYDYKWQTQDVIISLLVVMPELESLRCSLLFCLSKWRTIKWLISVISLCDAIFLFKYLTVFLLYLL